jgi:hypothetical protein
LLKEDSALAYVTGTVAVVLGAVSSDGAVLPEIVGVEAPAEDEVVLVW